MAGAGYDISLAMSDSKSATSGVTAPFSITGGGGSAPLSTAISAGQNSPTSATTTAPANKWLLYGLLAAGVIVLVILYRKYAK